MVVTRSLSRPLHPVATAYGLGFLLSCLGAPLPPMCARLFHFPLRFHWAFSPRIGLPDRVPRVDQLAGCGSKKKGGSR